MLDYVIQCIEYLDKDSEVLAEINKKAAHEGSTLSEQLSAIDTHKAALELVDALDALGIMDEVLNTMAIDPFRQDLKVNKPVNQNSSLDDTNGKTYEVYYTDENGNEMVDPALIRVPENLVGMELYEYIQEAFYEQYPGCMWDTIADADGDIKVDASSALNCSVHDNPALKLFVDKIKQTAKQVSAVPTTENDISGYKVIVRGMDSSEIEPIAAEFGLQLSGIKPLEGGFSVLVADDSLNSSNIDPETSELTDEGLRYRGYFITGSDKAGYVCISDYGKFSPAVYKTIDEAKEAIDKDMKIRFPDGDNLNSSVDTDRLYEIANRYCTSSPVSGDWDTETEHEMKAIMEELGVSESEAKRLMIDILGFDEAMLN